MTAQPQIRVNDVSKVFDSRVRGAASDVLALDDVNLSIEENSFVTLLGPSGCGKTTLLRCIAGLENPTSGVVEVAGKTVTKPSPERAMVFQSFALLPWRNVLDNVVFGLQLAGVSRAKREEKGREMIAAVGLERFEKALPGQLSGGMQQRVGLARALAVDAKVLLMDEPFGALDEQTKRIMQELLLDIWEKSRVTVAFITHSIDEAILLGDRVVVMSPRPGRIHRIVDVGLPRPRNRHVEESAEFVKLKASLWAELRGMSGQTSASEAEDAGIASGTN